MKTRSAGVRNAPPNKSFDRSANSVAFIRETWMLDMVSPRPVNSGVGLLPSDDGSDEEMRTMKTVRLALFTMSLILWESKKAKAWVNHLY